MYTIISRDNTFTTCTSTLMYNADSSAPGVQHDACCTLGSADEPPHDGMCAQRRLRSAWPGHPPSLFRVFAFRLKKYWASATLERTVKTLIRLGGRPG